MKLGKYLIGAITLLAFTINSPQVSATEDDNLSETIPAEVPEGVPHLDDDIDTYDFEVDDDYTFDEDEDITPPDSDDYVFDEDEDITPLDSNDYVFDEDENITPPDSDDYVFDEDEDIEPLDSDDYVFDEDEDFVPPNDKPNSPLNYDKHDYDFTDDYYDKPFDKPSTPNEDTEIISPPRDDNDRILPPSRIGIDEPKPEPKLKQLKTRFIKLAVDDTYTYYLDKQSVGWKRLPYSASEYMAEVWIRMIEHNPDNSDVPDYLSDTLEDDFSDQIEFAREKGYKFAPVDIEVLKHKHYYLEHYYLRPKTKQIQFLSELEVIGHPQNTIKERAYEYKNWEYLIPDSVEAIIYSTTLKEIGKSKASEQGHMTFADMLEEYGRISIR